MQSRCLHNLFSVCLVSLCFGLFETSAFAVQPVYRNHICCGAPSDPPASCGTTTSPDSQGAGVYVHATVAGGAADGSYSVSWTGAATGSTNFVVSGGVLSGSATRTVYQTSWTSGAFGVVNFSYGAGATGDAANEGFDGQEGGGYTCCTNGCSGVTEAQQVVEVTIGSATPTPTCTPAETCSWFLRIHVVASCPSGFPRDIPVQFAIDRTGCGPADTLVNNRIPAGLPVADLYFDGSDAQGTVVSITIDGQVLSHTVMCQGDPHPTNAWEADAHAGGNCGQPSPTPSPGGQTPAPTPPPAPSPPTSSPPPHVTPGPPVGTPSAGSVSVANVNDFYEPVRQAVRDSGNDSNVGSVAKVAPGDGEFGEDGREQITENTQGIADEVSGMVSKLAQMRADGEAALASIDPDFIGSTCTIDIPVTGWIATKLNITNWHLDFCQWADSIGLMRKLLLWTLYVAFFILTWKAVVYN